MALPNSHWEELEAFLAGLGFKEPLFQSRAFRSDCERFLVLLLAKNEVLNLTAVRDPEAAFWKHLGDSLALLAWEPLGTFADWGSGGGLPGIPMALARKHSKRPEGVVFVDSTGKKMRAIEEFGAALELGGCKYLVGRGEDLIRSGALGGVETVVMRAVAPPEKAVRWLSSRIPHWVFLLGPSQRALWESAMPEARRRGLQLNGELAYSLPRGMGDRVLLRLSKCST